MDKTTTNTPDKSLNNNSPLAKLKLVPRHCFACPGIPQFTFCEAKTRSSFLREYYNTTQIHLCVHHIVEDLIDITPDHSKYVYYCEKCYECFTSKEYIESIK